jgi:TolA-binding protein
MNIKATLLVLTLLSFTFFMLNNCAGTKGEGDDSISEEEKAQQQNLDDIESLLGISRSEPAKQPPPPKKVEKKDSDEEKLKLLETDELTSQQKTTSLSTYAAMSKNDKQQYDKKISKLENQINEKDIIIEDLKAIINRQDAEIQKLTIEKHSSGGYGGSQNIIIGDISSGEYQSRYDEARAEFEAHNYKAAIQYFESLLASSASHSLSDNAQYWIGECHYALRQYNSAIIDFEKVSTFTNSNKKDDAQFKLGVCYLRKGNKAKAMEEFERLQSDYPKSEYIPKINKVISRFND